MFSFRSKRDGLPSGERSIIKFAMSRVFRSFVKPSLGNVGTEITLNMEESHHLAKVLRRRIGDRVELLDGQGGVACAECLKVSKGAVTLRILNRVNIPSIIPYTRMLIALTKSAKWDELIKPLTELGVNQITPLFTERTEAKIDSVKVEGKITKWRKLAIEACKQSGNPWLPQIDQPMEFKKYLSSPKKKAWMASISATYSGELFSNISESIDLLIGPEGGWTQREEKMARECGIQFFSLGRWTLRTETASLSALAVARNHFLE